MSALLLAGLRTGAQALWVLLVAQALAHGIVLPDWMQNWFVETVVVTGAIALATWAIRWLESRTGDTFLAKAARWLGRVLMLGLSKKQPVYASPTDSKTILVGDADGNARAAVQ